MEGSNIEKIFVIIYQVRVEVVALTFKIEKVPVKINKERYK